MTSITLANDLYHFSSDRCDRLSIFQFQKNGTIAELTANDSGFTSGGVGASYGFNEKIFLNAEYEIIWMSNSDYKDGWLKSASIGLGVKL